MGRHPWPGRLFSWRWSPLCGPPTASALPEDSLHGLVKGNTLWSFFFYRIYIIPLGFLFLLKTKIPAIPVCYHLLPRLHSVLPLVASGSKWYYSTNTCRAL